MAAEWAETTLGELADFLSGGTPSKSRAEYWTGSVPWVSAKDMKRFRLADTEDHVSKDAVGNGTRLVPAGTVFLLTRGMTLLNDVPICVAQRPMTFNQDVKALRPRPHVASEYLPYVLLANRERLLSQVDLAGHGTGRLNTDELKALEVCLPDLPEQRAIAHVLGTLDDKIELNRRMNETLEAMAQALFKSWFVDFDPVRAKAEGRDPGLPEPLSKLFPDRLVDSELGQIPEGWEVRDVYWCAEVIYGAPFKSALFNEEGIGHPLVRIRDLRSHNPGVWTSEEHPRGYLVRPGDLLVGMDGEFRAYFWRGPTAWLNQRVCCFKPLTGVPRAFVHYSIQALLDFFERSKTGTTVIHLGKGDIDTFRILKPSARVLQAFGALVDPVDARAVAAATESCTLTAARDALLPILVSGELRVPDPTKFIGPGGP